MLRRLAAPVAILAAAAVLATLLQPASLGQIVTEHVEARKQTWEYDIHSMLQTIDTDALNRLGADGWELIDVTVTQNPTPQFTFYFKRAK